MLAFSPRRLRLVSGCVLFAYLFSHLINHALGLWSLAAAESALGIAAAFWQNRVVTLVLASAAATHLALALFTIYQRRSWRLPFIEIIRLWAGFMLPLLLIRHAVAARVSYEGFGVTMTYGQTILSLIANDAQAWQLGLLAPGWLHGCLGLWLTLRRFPALERAKALLVALALAVPLASAGGFLAMNHTLKSQPHLAASVPLSEPHLSARRDVARLWQEGLTKGYCLAIALAFLGGVVRNRRAQSRH